MKKILIAGAILAAPILFPHNTSALSVDFNLPNNLLGTFDHKSKVEEKAERLEKKLEKVNMAQEEAASLNEKREELQSSLKNIEKDILDIAQQVEEKKALEQAAKEAAKKAEEEAKRLASLVVKPTRYASDASGNAYAPGNCTFYVKQKRPDIGNYWGNANSWMSSAASQGWKTGSVPKVGAIAATSAGYYGHVAYVEAVNGNTITISEMNAQGLGVISTRTASASEFQYIYNLD